MIIFCCPFNTAAQSKQPKNNFLLRGIFKGRDTGIIILRYPNVNDKWQSDTAILTNGKFQFSGYLSQPSFCWLKGSSSNGNSVSFFLEPGIEHIYLEENNFDNFKMQGSFTQLQEDSLKQQIDVAQAKYKNGLEEYTELVKKTKEITDSTAIKQMKARLLQLSDSVVGPSNDETRDIKMAFIISHPDSYVSPTYLYSLIFNRQVQTDSAESLYSNFTGMIQQSNTGKLIREELNKRRVNIEAPDFFAKNDEGKNVSLQNFKGKYILLDFWASWCQPCLKKLPGLKDLFNKYNKNGFEIITMSLDTDMDSWKKAISRNKIEKFCNLIRNEDIDNKYSNTKQPIPSEILINKKGIIVWNSLNEPSETLEQVLAKEFSY
ncbi:redoxin domain-containing protein [Parafilimonas sp.]|uniref:redoxin domain-containing protein n=1 Tax=Parafilimonas sp. TaxID=1969739 RepID=UPI0039E5EE71